MTTSFDQYGNQREWQAILMLLAKAFFQVRLVATRPGPIDGHGDRGSARALNALKRSSILRTEGDRRKGNERG